MSITYNYVYYVNKQVHDRDTVMHKKQKKHYRNHKINQYSVHHRQCTVYVFE